jgi:hypothetical protein
MSFVFAGYFPKRIVARDEWLKAPAVREIWSVSGCISKGPSDWIDQWRHNDFGLFDTQELAHSVVPGDERGRYTIVGYRVWDRMFDQGTEVEVPAAPAPVPGPDEGFVTVGFDAVARSGMYCFECSPLSCNGGASTFPTNERCLFRTPEEAMSGAREFSMGHWEPGPYWVVEVLSRPEATAQPTVAADDASHRR